MKYVLFYDPAENIGAVAPLHFPAHRARADDFHARGTLLMIGTFTDAQADGAMAIFTTGDAAEEFARGDPFVLHGVVRAWRIRAWNEAFTEP